MTSQTTTNDKVSTLAGPTAQSYLIGDTIYLRGAELGDAKWATAWRPTPFPISAEEAEKQLKKNVPQDDGEAGVATDCLSTRQRPPGGMGSSSMNQIPPRRPSRCMPTPRSAPLAAQVQAEVLGRVVPWLSGERYRPVVVLATDTDFEPVVMADGSRFFGMRPAVRLS